MAIVYLAHHVSTDEVIENESLYILVEYLAKDKPHVPIKEYTLYKCDTAIGFEYATKLDKEQEDMAHSTHGLITHLVELETKVRFYEPEPAYYESVVTIKVDVLVANANLNGKGSTLQPAVLLQQALHGEEGYSIGDYMVDSIMVTNKFNEVILHEDDEDEDDILQDPAFIVHD